MNEIWRIDSDNLAAYTEDKAVMRKIRRSYRDTFTVMATYQKAGQLIGVQYRIPSDKKRTIRRMLGVDVVR
jgi:hypothetical protein